MDGPAWTRWFLTDEGLRAPWRILLFVSLFILLMATQAALLPALTGLEVPGDRISLGLVVRSGMALVAALAAAFILLRWVDRRSRHGLGFPADRRALPELGLGVLIGAGALAAVVLALVVGGGYRYGPDSGSLSGWLATAGLALAALALPAAYEEALLRGYPFRALLEGPGAVAAVLITSVVFAWLHGGNPNVGTFGLVNIFLAGVLLAVAVLRTGTLWLATGVHLGWNWAMSGPLDLPVSGLQGFDAPLYDVTVVGPAWLTGGSFGPEGGLAGTAAATLALSLILWTTRPGALLARENDRREGHVSNR